jgi:hypothetical protein
MDIEARLKRLERTNRLLLLLLAIAAITFWRTASSLHVDAAPQPGDIVASSIETRSLAVVNPTGKQGVKIAVGDDGMVSLEMTDVNGRESIGLLSDPDGKPSVCLAYRNVCRVVIGDVYRGSQREISVQLRSRDGKPIWMPAAPNPIAVGRPSGPSR